MIYKKRGQTSLKGFSGKTPGLEYEFSVYYHDVFDFPLTQKELVKWKYGGGKMRSKRYINTKISKKNGYFFLKGKQGLIKKRKERNIISEKKIKLAEKAGRTISKIPTVRMVGITGALSMKNADINSDIDLMIITNKNSLWTTRFLVWVLMKLKKFPMRKAGDKDAKDKLCLNMWVDEGFLEWNKKDRNLFTAHEILQLFPIVNKGKTYEKFVKRNRWVKKYWPNAQVLRKTESQVEDNNLLKLTAILCFFTEPVARRVQFEFMRKRITNETIEPQRAFFHPVDLSNIILSKL